VISGFDPSSGALLYTPAANYNGLDTFTFTVFDGSLYATGLVSITVTPLNDAPIADDQSVSTPEDTAKSIVLTGSDVDSTNLTFAVLAGPTHGAVSGLNTNTGALLYMPATNYNGLDGFTFMVFDGSLYATGLVSITVTPVNDAPLADDQSVTTPEDTARSIVLTGSDVDSTNLTFAILAGPANGVISGFNASTGALLYTPATNYNGPDSLTFSLSDGFLQATGTVSITVTPVNDGPVALDDTTSTPKNTPVLISVLANDSDVDGDVLTITSATPTNGAVSIVGTNLLFTPASNYVGVATIGYAISDGNGGTASALVTVNVTLGTNTPPVAQNDTATTPEDIAVTIAPLFNDSDVDGDPLTITGASATNGTVSNVGGTNLVFTPAANFNGTATIHYTISDGQGGTASANVTVTVTPVNDAPVADNQSVTTPEDTAKSIVLTGSDVDSTNLTFAILAGPTNGAISGFNASTGALLYTPTTNYNGPDSFTFTLSDGSLQATGTVSISVTPVNDAPLADDQSVTTPEDTAKSMVLTGSDVDGTNLTFTILTLSTNGVLSGLNTNTGALLYTPATNYNGLDGFTFAVFDGSLYATGTVSITVTPVNDAPVAVDDTSSTPKNIPVLISVLANDSDVDGDVLTITSATPTNGAVGIVGTNLLFTPASNFVGVATIGYAISDGNGGTASALVTVIVTLGTNTPPVAVDDTATISEDTVLTMDPRNNDYDVDGDPLTITAASATNGTVSILGGTNLVFTPATNFNGTASIRYTISDGLGGTASADVTVTVTPVNDAPIANNQSVATPRNTARNIVLTGSDVDSTNLTYAILNGPTNGAISGLDTNSGALIYTPATAYLGLDDFTFTVFDGSLYATGNVSITVTLSNRPPVAINDAAYTHKNTAVTLYPLVNDSDPDSDSLTITSLSPTNGTASIIGGTNVIFLPKTNFFGNAKIGYTISDGLGGTASALITVHVTNRPPVAVNDFAATTKNTAVRIGPLANDSDLDGDSLTIISVSPTNGTASIIGGTNVLFRPKTNFTGTGKVRYTISDGFGKTASALITVNVTNRLPVAVNDFASTTENTPVTIKPLVNDSDPDGDRLTIISLRATNGTASIVGGTNVLFRPATNFTGVATIGYTIGDGYAGRASALITVSVTAAADVAVFKTGPANSRAGSNITFTITITNRGPSTAANVVVYDQLPAGFQFISGLPTEAGVSNNLVSWPAISLANHKTTNFQVTARSSAAGLFTNIAFSISDTPDPNPANNNGTAVGSQAKVSVTTNAAAPQFAIRAGTNVFNPQTGLFEQHVTVTNTGTGTAAAVRLLVGGLRSGVTLYNASGTNGTRPYVQYNAPLNPGQTVAFLLEFYVPDRRPFTDTLEAQAVFPATGRTNLTGGVAIDKSFFDYRIAGEPRFVIEFASIPGRTYIVVFSSDLKNWTAATPSITANANRTQWYDDGPPKTTSKPLSAASRYYQVILAPANP
jgi:RNase H-fold protein (predicted Holliday junction resolvase)